MFRVDRVLHSIIVSDFIQMFWGTVMNESCFMLHSKAGEAVFEYDVNIYMHSHIFCIRHFLQWTVLFKEWGCSWTNNSAELLVSKPVLNSSCNVEELSFTLCFPKVGGNRYTFFSCLLLSYISIILLNFILVTVKAKTNKCSKTNCAMNLRGKRFVNWYLICYDYNETLEKRGTYHLMSDDVIFSWDASS